MNYILFDKVNKSFGFEKVLNQLSLKISKYEHIGLIGINGCGKTTLFKLILGAESPDSGSVIKRKDIVIGYLEQETQIYDKMSIEEVFMLAFKEVLSSIDTLSEIEEKLAKAPDDEIEILLNKYGNVQHFIESKNGYNLDSKIDIVAYGLGIFKSQYGALLSDLSGGEKTRVFLVKLLLEEPDILLLDEPTNHLDLLAVDWLEKYINSYKGTVVVISHDRVFLDNTVKKIIEIENGRAIEYPGNYSWYKAEKKKRDEIQTKLYSSQQKEVKRLEKAAKNMREWAKQADNPAMFKRAVNVERRIEHMDKIKKPLGRYVSMQLEINNTSKTGKEVILIKNLSKAYQKNVLFKSLNLLIRKGEKAVISGENGCGKTTLINILTGTVLPDEGNAIIGSGISYSLLPQETVYEDPDCSILDEVRRGLLTDGNNARRILAKFGFRGSHVMKRISELSGGERKRLKLCILMQCQNSLLIMDEPTNHMDISSREILEDALGKYTGTCFFISHDRFFIQKTCERKFLLKESTLYEYDGDYIDCFNNTQSEISPLENKSSKRKRGNSLREAQNYLLGLEKEIGLMEKDLEYISAKMTAESSYEELQQLSDEKYRTENKLDLLYIEWEKKS